jgi:8-oxo-dGTP pyrophosphatase MutT (NUDIX family)
MDRSYGAVVTTDRLGAPLYLLVLHSSGSHWDLPKGHPLDGEAVEETIKREVREETGCAIRLVPGFEDSISYALPGGETKEVRFRLGLLVEPQCVFLPNREIRAVGWFSFEEARRLMTYDNSREVLNRADGFVRGRTFRRGADCPARPPRGTVERRTGRSGARGATDAG